MEPNPLLEVQKYQKVQTLGQGSFGFVQLARNQAGELAAIKVRAPLVARRAGMERTDVRRRWKGS